MQTDNLRREHPSTYIVQSRTHSDELRRLEIQDKMLTAGMGGVLPEIADPSALRRVLDVGCGTGGWLLETARTYPSIAKLIGADISDKMLACASTRAQAWDLAERVEFCPMDALRILEFRTSFFDLVNQRLGASWLRTWEWTKILLEYQRVLRPGGTVRITEMHGLIESNSPALTQLGDLSLEAFWHSGRLFSPKGDGLTSQLPRILMQHGFENIWTYLHTIIFRAGTPEGLCFYEDMAIAYRVSLPFFQKWTCVPDDYEEIREQALIEMQQPDFEATWTLLTVIATAPMSGLPMLIRGLP